MTVTPPAGPLGPYVTGAELAAHLGGVPGATDLDGIAYAATMAIWAVVADPGWLAPDDPPPAGVRQCTLMVGAEVYKAGAAPGGEYQMDPFTASAQVVTSNLVRKYGPLLAPWRAVGGLAG